MPTNCECKAEASNVDEVVKANETGESYSVVVVGEGGMAIAGQFGVAVAGLTQKVHDTTKTKAVSGNHAWSITSDEGCSKTGNYGVAASGRSGCACSGQGGVSRVGEAGYASSTNGGVSFVAGAKGCASTGQWGVAYCLDGGKATAGDKGVAISRDGVFGSGSTSAGEGGVIIIFTCANKGDTSMPKIGLIKPNGPLEPNVIYKLDEAGNFVPAE